jgi:hypothetical protein
MFTCMFYPASKEMDSGSGLDMAIRSFKRGVLDSDAGLIRAGLKSQ